MDHTAFRQDHRRRFASLAGALLAACFAFSGCVRSPEAKEARYLENGKKQVEQKDYARAVIQFRNAAQAMPKDAEPYYQLALAYLAQGDIRSGVASLNKALQLNPKHQQAQLKKAELMTFSNNKDDVTHAQQVIHELLNTAPASAEELDALAVTEMRLGQQQDAEKHLEEALAKFPKDLTAAISLAGAKRAHNDPAGAEDVLKKAAAQQPPSANAWIALGQFYMSTGRAADAETQFRHAIQIDPKSGPAILSLAILQVRTNKLDQAEQTYAQLAALPDKQYMAYHATFLAARGKHDQAIAEFQKLSRQYSDDRAIRSYLFQEYLRAQKPGEAEKLVTEAIRKNSKDVDALIQRSGIYLTAGRVEDAQKDLTQALRFRAESPEAHYLMAQVHQMRRAGLNERQELGEALRLRPGYLPARVRLCQSLIASGAAQAALDLMDGVPKPQKNTLAYLVNRNWALLALHQSAEARKEVDRGLAAVKSPELLMQDAYLRLEQKDYSSARASLAEALNKSPEDLRILRMIVASYVTQKQPAAAIRLVQDHAAQHPKSAPLQQFVAELFMSNGQRAEARAALFAAKAANPKFVQADITLAQLDAADGRLDGAVKALSAVLAQNPNNIAARTQFAAMEDQSGNHAAAVDAYKKVLELEPANILALNNLAYDLAEYGNQADEALKYAQKASELAPDAAAVENTLGWVLYRKGMYSMALPYLEKAADKEPSARRKCHVAMAYLRMGDKERAQQNLGAALKLDPNIPEIRTAQQILDEMQSGR